MTRTERDDAPERRVLVCADESEPGELARQWAAHCAHELGVALVTLHGSVAAPVATLASARPTDLLVLGLGDHHWHVPEAVVGARRTHHPGLGLVTRTALYHARSPVAVARASAKNPQAGANPLPTPRRHSDLLSRLDHNTTPHQPTDIGE